MFLQHMHPPVELHVCLLLQLEKEYEAAALDVLHNKCTIQDVFADSRFLKPEALQALVAAIISAPGHLPSPPPVAAGQHGPASGVQGDSSYQRSHADRAAAGAAVDWEAAELCLDLLLVSEVGRSAVTRFEPLLWHVWCLHSCSAPGSRAPPA